MEGKKISFGFLKTKKQDKILVVDKKEYIESVEEKSIKVIGGETTKEEKPLVIPMKPNTLITAEKLKEIAKKAEDFEEVSVKVEKDSQETEIPKNETLEQMAARELLQEAKKEITVETPKLVVSINSKPDFEGKSESTLDDYESIPIQEFGMAMLRGMGWTQGKESSYKQPQLRPKGLGLGADKVITDKKQNKQKGQEEELPIVKNSLVKVTTGKHSGFYGKIISLDEDNGRIMVELTIKRETVSLSEFMVQAVTKSEFDKESKVINHDKYEEYKRIESSGNKSENKKDKSSTSKPSYQGESRGSETGHWSNGSNRRSRSKERRRHKKDSSSSEEDRSRHRKKTKKKYSSNESLTSCSDKDRSVSRRRPSDSDSSSSGYRKKHKKSKSKYSKVKQDIDKKRKGKKKKRDRDRSPHYKKHRK